MRKLVLFALLSFVIPTFAQDATTANPTSVVMAKSLKIGVVDVKTIVQKSPQLQSINTQLTQKFKPREAAIVQAQASFKAEEEKYNKSSGTMSDADRTKIEHQLITDRANLQAMITAFQQDLDNEQNSSMQKLLSQIASIVNGIGKKEHYDLILQGETVAYVTDPLDLTDEVLQKLSANA